MRSEEREDSREGNHRQRRERENPPDEEQREVLPEAQGPPEDDEWNFLEGGAEDFEIDDEATVDSRSDQSGVPTQTTRATIFERLKRSAPADRSIPPSSKKLARQEECLRHVRNALNVRHYRPTSIWDYETKTPWLATFPAFFERRAFREWEEQGHTLQWYATGEIITQLLTEAVSLLNLAQEIRSNSAGKFLNSALATTIGHVEVTIPALRSEAAKHLKKTTKVSISI